MENGQNSLLANPDSNNIYIKNNEKYISQHSCYHYSYLQFYHQLMSILK